MVTAAVSDGTEATRPAFPETTLARSAGSSNGDFPEIGCRERQAP